VALRPDLLRHRPPPRRCTEVITSTRWTSSDIAVRLGSCLGPHAMPPVRSKRGPLHQCSRGTLTGEVTYVRDGDTIELGEMAIRLQGPRRPSGMNPADARRARR
jgi:endonuclease YncB( thermonuclease family)